MLQTPKVYLFFGCRTKGVDLYCDEKEEMQQKGVLTKVFLALSREPNLPKVRETIILSHYQHDCRPKPKHLVLDPKSALNCLTNCNLLQFILCLYKKFYIFISIYLVRSSRRMFRMLQNEKRTIFISWSLRSGAMFMCVAM